MCKCGQVIRFSQPDNIRVYILSAFPLLCSHNYYSVFQYLICCRRRPRLIQNVAIFLIKGCKRNQNNREPVTPAGHPPNYMARTASLCASVYFYVCVCVKYAMIYASLLNVAEVFALILRNCRAVSAACSVQRVCGNCGQCQPQFGYVIPNCQFRARII